MVGASEQRPARDELSLGYVQQLVEDVQADLADLDRAAPSDGDEPADSTLAILGVSGEIRVPRAGARRSWRTCASRLAVACYPRPEEHHEDEKENRSWATC